MDCIVGGGLTTDRYQAKTIETTELADIKSFPSCTKSNSALYQIRIFGNEVV
jgi:hypothetical protein